MDSLEGTSAISPLPLPKIVDMDEPRPRSRGNAVRPTSQQGEVVKKVFNCIVDDSALIQGAKKSTRDGIPKWVASGRVRLFVPLSALDRTSRVKSGKGRVARDAAEALAWLDDATSKHPNLVVLQGGFDQYGSWKEVEAFAQPKTLFCEDEFDGDTAVTSISGETEKMGPDNNGEEVGQSFSSNDSLASASSTQSHGTGRSGSPLSPPTSPPQDKAGLAKDASDDGPKTTVHLTKSGDAAEIPQSVRPLINYIIWRVHQETNPIEALDSFIFLSDSQAMRKYAHRFGIRSKTLSEIRYVIARESQDARNRHLVQQKTANNMIRTPVHSRQSSADTSRRGTRPASRDDPKQAAVELPATEMNNSDDDEILLKRAPKAPAALLAQPSRGGRVSVSNAPRAPRSNAARHPTGSPKSGLRPTPSGRGGPSLRGRKSVQAQPTEPIDPDSFARPIPLRGSARGGKGLWMPT